MIVSQPINCYDGVDFREKALRKRHNDKLYDMQKAPLLSRPAGI